MSGSYRIEQATGRFGGFPVARRVSDHQSAVRRVTILSRHGGEVLGLLTEFLACDELRVVRQVILVPLAS